MKTLIKQMWAQRRANGWIFFELILVFVVAWMAIDPIYVIQYQRNVIHSGFDPKDMYAVSVGEYAAIAHKYDPSRATTEALNEDLERMILLVENFPGVEAVCGVNGQIPYSGSYWGEGMKLPGDSVDVGFQILQYIPTQDYIKVFHYTSSIDHTWESLDELDIPANGLIISEDVKNKVFGDEPAIGKTVIVQEDLFLIAGVMDMVKRAPSAQPAYCALVPTKMYDADEFSWGSVKLMIRVKPGTSERKFIARFNEELAPKLQYGNLFINDIRPYSDCGDDMSTWDESDTTLQMMTIITSFFLLVVFLGVIATFWFRVETRKEEIGIRMATGSTRSQIRRRMMNESLLLVLFTSIIGLIIVVNIVNIKGLYAYQAQKLDEFWAVNNPFPHFVIVTLIVLAILVAIVSIATAIPASRTANIKPVDALRDE